MPEPVHPKGRLKQLLPGIYQDEEGAAYWVVDEWLKANGEADTPENREAVRRVVERGAAKMGVPFHETGTLIKPAEER